MEVTILDLTILFFFGFILGLLVSRFYWSYKYDPLMDELLRKNRELHRRVEPS
jgi:hypothetical protein